MFCFVFAVRYLFHYLLFTPCYIFAVCGLWFAVWCLLFALVIGIVVVIVIAIVIALHMHSAIAAIADFLFSNSDFLSFRIF